VQRQPPAASRQPPAASRQPPAASRQPPAAHAPPRLRSAVGAASWASSCRVCAQLERCCRCWRWRRRCFPAACSPSCRRSLPAGPTRVAVDMSRRAGAQVEDQKTQLAKEHARGLDDKREALVSAAPVPPRRPQTCCAGVVCEQRLVVLERDNYKAQLEGLRGAACWAHVCGCPGRLKLCCAPCQTKWRRIQCCIWS
jgi:hypothetical protein